MEEYFKKVANFLGWNSEKQPIENNKGDLDGRRAAMNKADLSGTNGGNISGSNFIKGDRGGDGCNSYNGDSFSGGVRSMASASLPSSSSRSAHGLKYDVFLSFRDSDTRKGITSELHRQLTERGIETFMDTNLQVGDVISPALLKAIEESRFAIVILSPNYASSTRCLQEIAKICQCMEYNNRILPLFFNVEPEHLSSEKKGSFKEAFTNYENSGLYRSEKLKEWKDALTKVANFLGWNSKHYKTERELVNKIVEDMYSTVQPIENNKGDLEATREAKNKAHVASGVNVSGGYISGDNVNFGEQGDVVKGVHGDFIKGVHGHFIKGGPNGDIIRGDRGGDGGDSYIGGFAGAGGPAKGNNIFNYGNQ